MGPLEVLLQRNIIDMSYYNSINIILVTKMDEVHISKNFIIQADGVQVKDERDRLIRKISDTAIQIDIHER